MGQLTETIRTTALATTVSDATAPYVVRCIDRHVPDLRDRVAIAQALGLLPDTGRARSHGEPGRTVAREATG